MMLLQRIVRDELYSFADSFDDWEDAVYASCKRLIEKGYIDDKYAHSIVNNVKEHGPYIVLIPGVAMPHSTQNAEGIYKTGIAMMKVRNRVYFEGDDDKYATLLFTLAAENDEEHLENIQQLMELLMDDKVLEVLQNINSELELKQYLETLQEENDGISS